jgi:hypothetical protein
VTKGITKLKYFAKKKTVWIWEFEAFQVKFLKVEQNAFFHSAQGFIPSVESHKYSNISDNIYKEMFDKGKILKTLMLLSLLRSVLTRLVCTGLY